MKTALKEGFWGYIIVHHPELMFDLQEDYRVSRYLDEKIGDVMEGSSYLGWMKLDTASIYDRCMSMLTEELGSSRFLLVKRLLREEFPTAYLQLQDEYVLNYEVLNILGSCEEIFLQFGPSAPKENQKVLHYAIIAEIDTYLKDTLKLTSGLS